MITITGQARTRQVERRMLAAVRGGLGKEMAGGLDRAAKPFRPAISARAAATMPGRYAPALARSVRVNTQIRSSATTADALLKVYAQGRTARRHLPAVNRGRLRHPLYGNRNHWFAQRVTPGVVDVPARRLRPAAFREMERVVRDVSKRMGG